MKKNIFTFIILLGTCLSMWAQIPATGNMGARRGNLNSGMPNSLDPDSLIGKNKIDANTVPHDVRAWKINPRFGEILPADVDTLHLNFQNTNETYGMNGEYNMLGNMGSPRLSRIFINRLPNSENIFLDPLDFFVRRPDNTLFYNTKSPFTNLTYYSSGDKTVGDDRFKALFTVNGNKRLNVGFVFDYLYGRGYYLYQANSYFNGSLFSSYTGDKYQMHFLFSANHMKQAENGGIEDDEFIKHPENLSQSISSNTIPTILSSTWNRNDGKSVYLTHRYNVGFYRAQQDSTKNDSVVKRDFIPVTSFIHTLQVDQNHHQFISRDNIDGYFADNFYRDETDRDENRYFAIKNTFGIQLKEGFNKWAQAGLTGFVKHNMRSYELPDWSESDTIYRKKFNENLVSIGGELRRAQGKHINYSVTAESTLTGADAGDISLNADLNLKFKLFNDTINLAATGYIKNQTPTFLFRHYHAHNFWWDNDDLSKEMRTRIEGTLSSKRTGTTIRVGVEHMKNYTYLDNQTQGVYGLDGNLKYWSQRANVAQHDDNLEVFTAQLIQKLKFGGLHWDSEVTYQAVNNQDVLPLPKLNVYSNVYFDFNIVKNVMRMQLGADVRYFTKYYAPDYLPALGQYYLQNKENLVEIGNYPMINTYLNAEWKRTRIYAMVFYHINQGKGDRNYFLAPHYPINPMIFKLGISWNFYD